MFKIFSAVGSLRSRHLLMNSAAKCGVIRSSVYENGLASPKSLRVVDEASWIRRLLHLMILCMTVSNVQDASSTFAIANALGKLVIQRSGGCFGNIGRRCEFMKTP